MYKIKSKVNYKFVKYSVKYFGIGKCCFKSWILCSLLVCALLLTSNTCQVNIANNNAIM